MSIFNNSFTMWSAGYAHGARQELQRVADSTPEWFDLLCSDSEDTPGFVDMMCTCSERLDEFRVIIEIELEKTL